jgi:hypothetical protein
VLKIVPENTTRPEAERYCVGRTVMYMTAGFTASDETCLVLFFGPWVLDARWKMYVFIRWKIYVFTRWKFYVYTRWKMYVYSLRGWGEGAWRGAEGGTLWYILY